MTILHDFRLMQVIILATQPRPQIDIVLSTHCPVETEHGIVCDYNGKNYMIAHFAMVRRIEHDYYFRQGRSSSAIGNSAFGGAIVIENEPLVAKILLHHDKQPDNPFVLAELAKGWAIEQIEHYDVTFAQNG